MERPPTLVFSNEDIYIPIRPTQPAVHFLDFTDKIDLTTSKKRGDGSSYDNKYDHRSSVWQVNVGTPPQRRQQSYRIKDLLKDTKQWTIVPPDPDDPWKGMFEGDLVVFASLVVDNTNDGSSSTAGDDYDGTGISSYLYNHVRFVGPEHVELHVNEDGESWYDILVDLLSISSSSSSTNMNNNTFDFPIKVLEMINYNAATLKAVYEKLFNVIIANIPATAAASSSSGGVTMTLFDGVFSSDNESYDKFWTNAVRTPHQHSPYQPGVLPMGGEGVGGGGGYVVDNKLPPWTFSFGDCIWIETVRWEDKKEDASSSANHGVGGGQGIGMTSYGNLGRVSKAELASALEDMGNILSNEF